MPPTRLLTMASAAFCVIESFWKSDLSPMYDDMMENLKVRYVITYRSSNDADLNSPRTVRVELVDESTGGPLQIIDANGRRIRAKVIVQDSYSPSAASGGRVDTEH